MVLIFNDFDSVLDRKTLQRVFGNGFRFMACDSVSEAFELKEKHPSFDIRVYSPRNFKRFNELMKTLESPNLSKRWFRSFDDVGVPKYVFDKEIDMWGRRQVIQEVPLLLVKGALPGKDYVNVDEHGEDRWTINEGHIEYLAQFCRGMDRINLYGALSEREEDRKVAKKVVDRIYQRFQSKREQRLGERIRVLQEIQGLDYVAYDMVPSRSQVTNSSKPDVVSKEVSSKKGLLGLLSFGR